MSGVTGRLTRRQHGNDTALKLHLEAILRHTPQLGATQAIWRKTKAPDLKLPVSWIRLARLLRPSCNKEKREELSPWCFVGGGLGLFLLFF